MRTASRPLGTVLTGCLILLLTCFNTSAQTKGRMTIQATAMGTSTQLGRIYDVNIYIQGYSTQDDRKTLINAFNRKGQDGLVRELQDMSSKGRVRFASGGVGNDVKYIYELPAKNGRRFRLVTDRNLAFGELRNSTRSREYSIGGAELTIGESSRTH